MVGQNIQGKHAELRAEHDFETDKKAEREIETILFHLENQQKLMLEILRRIEKLENPTSPIRLGSGLRGVNPTAARLRGVKKR